MTLLLLLLNINWEQQYVSSFLLISNWWFVNSKEKNKGSSILVPKVNRLKETNKIMSSHLYDTNNAKRKWKAKEWHKIVNPHEPENVHNHVQVEFHLIKYDKCHRGQKLNCSGLVRNPMVVYSQARLYNDRLLDYSTGPEKLSSFHYSK